MHPQLSNLANESSKFSDCNLSDKEDGQISFAYCFIRSVFPFCNRYTLTNTTADNSSIS